MAFAVAATCNPCLARPVPPAMQNRAARVRLAPPRSSFRSEAVDMSGEWEAVTSLSSQDDVLAYVNHQHQPKNTRLHDVMQTNLLLTSPDTTLEEVTKLLEGPPMIEGLPVVDAAKKLVGVVSKKDLSKGGALVKDIMSTPAISLKASAPVADAATCMVTHKFHRVPVVDDDNVCVGIVTRTDIFWVLTQSDQEGGADSHFKQHGLDV